MVSAVSNKLEDKMKQGKLKDDNRKCVTAFTDSFEYEKETRVILEIEEVQDGEKTSRRDDNS